MREREGEEMAGRLRLSTHTGRPLATDSLLSKLEHMLGRRLRPLPVGTAEEGGKAGTREEDGQGAVDGPRPPRSCPWGPSGGRPESVAGCGWHSRSAPRSAAPASGENILTRSLS